MLESLSNVPRDYAWGSPTLIPNLQGRAPDGTPEAEVWFGDHPGSPARIADGRTLVEVRAAAGQEPLPYLLKILAASMSLSIQAHPSVAEAIEGFAREDAAGIAVDAAERTYRDRNHKPEIIVALSERFRALVGLRPVEGTDALLAVLPQLPGVRGLRAALQGADEAGVLRAVIDDALSGRVPEIVADLAAALGDPAAGASAEVEVLRAIAKDFPGDPGLVVAALMNLVVLSAGQAVFAPAGVLHAYQDGLGVELMAASDNVLRGGLTPKHVDVGELLRIVDTRPGPAPVLAPTTDGPAEVFDAGVPDFLLARIEVDGAVALPLDGPAIVLAVAGEVGVAAGVGRVELRQGAAAYADGEPSLAFDGHGTVYVAQPGRA
ncbi:mannose-6-phosphate isomerase, class I [Microbacterium dauci]|uniref:mannose-6-phosphate isomerase n=1 Tax=Microbacterium dauci TaxID=3048008 RepID=A0ABT6Z9W8_9MICO|nr:mannose-6-phosphate isomerase, class I [Microbacterium sp. LX3-4]MDJ1112949.1 mannose-6-phosphate isomerase, class I [Microbacterium sp. LX3-4]